MTAIELVDRRGTVTVTEETVTRDDGTTVVNRYVVTGSTGYRADLPACYADDCLDGRRKPCTTPTGKGGQHPVNGKTSVGAWLAHSKGHCHGWHAPTVERFAQNVLKTFRRWRPTQPTLPGVTPYMRNSQSALVECPAWPVLPDKRLPAAYQPLLTGCDCESCQATVALFARAA